MKAADRAAAAAEERRLNAKLKQIRARESYQYFVSETIERKRDKAAVSSNPLYLMCFPSWWCGEILILVAIASALPGYHYRVVMGGR